MERTRIYVEISVIDARYAILHVAYLISRNLRQLCFSFFAVERSKENFAGPLAEFTAHADTKGFSVTRLLSGYAKDASHYEALNRDPTAPDRSWRELKFC